MIYAKVRKVKNPLRSHNDDAGIDFFMPEFTKDFIKDLSLKNKGKKFSINNEAKEIYLEPHESILIPSGIKVNLTKTKKLIGWDGIALCAYNKSGVASGRQLDRLAEVIDESYQGEIHINLVNTSNHIISLKENEKIIQFLIQHISYQKPEEVPAEELYENTTSRGEGGFGSTGKF